MLVGADDCRIEHDELVVRVSRQHLENAQKHATFAPSAVTAMRRFPRAIPFRQIAPGHASAIPIEHSIDEQAIVSSRAADMPNTTRQEILQPQPLVVAQSKALPASASRLPTTYESEKDRFENPANDDCDQAAVSFLTYCGIRNSAQLTTRPSPRKVRRSNIYFIP